MNETRAFNLFDGKDIAPKFLGHLMEKERLMGILMEYIPGRHAPPEDEAVCRNVLKRLHEFKIVWNDPLNDGNFVITENGKAHMLDFSNSTFDADEILLKEEEDKLYEELQNYTGNEEEGDLSYGQERLKSMPDGIYKI